ncbi:MAG TPA: hypothetical protein VNY05_29580 [Candidatus Acidoferrales bacterium]|jgi:hypothetical protein|nr:hypothetical protein [Candidatus Acidoferrales bacterium]
MDQEENTQFSDALDDETPAQKQVFEDDAVAGIARVLGLSLEDAKKWIDA